MSVPSWFPVYSIARAEGITPWELEAAPADWVARLLAMHSIRSSVKRS